MTAPAAPEDLPPRVFPPIPPPTLPWRRSGQERSPRAPWHGRELYLVWTLQQKLNHATPATRTVIDPRGVAHTVAAPCLFCSESPSFYDPFLPLAQQGRCTENPSACVACLSRCMMCQKVQKRSIVFGHFGPAEWATLQHSVRVCDRCIKNPLKPGLGLSQYAFACRCCRTIVTDPALGSEHPKDRVEMHRQQCCASCIWEMPAETRTRFRADVEACKSASQFLEECLLQPALPLSF